MSDRTVILIQCRLESTRLPRKALIDICGRPLLNQLFRRMAACRQAECVAVCCPESDVEEIKKATLLPCFGGPEQDILTRLMDAANAYQADRIVRVTGDNPLSDPIMIDHMINLSKSYDTPIITNWKPRLFPDGVDAEVYKVTNLRAISRDLTDMGDREWFASWCANNLPADWIQGLKSNVDRSLYRITVDYPEDLDVVRAIFRAMKNEVWDSSMVINWLDQHPEIKKMNKHRISDFGARPK